MSEQKKLSNDDIIHTDYLKFRNNTVEWGNTTLQLSNISSLSTYKYVEQIPFPKISLLLLLIGLLFISLPSYLNISVIGYLVLAISIGWIFLWWYKKNNPDKTLALHIMMNSGAVYSIGFNQAKFLQEALERFTNIIDAGGTHGVPVIANIVNNRFEDKVSINNVKNNTVGGNINL